MKITVVTFPVQKKSKMKLPGCLFLRIREKTLSYSYLVVDYVIMDNLDICPNIIGSTKLKLFQTYAIQ